MTASRVFAKVLASLLLALAGSPAGAFDFRSVGQSAVVLYDAPSSRSTRRYVAPPGMPVEILSRYGIWVKVRDIDGDTAWTEAKGLSARRHVVVKAPQARVRAAADDNAALLMTADKGVLLELVDPQAGEWVRVRHQDGIGGFVRAFEVWGI
ncbi:SH3 domain-containing protein [Massilia sp. GCM10023247]|uniref:SH3 domain-containing protein n=1 Tax=Massilia sp. GCM10023247 TaxID=3252643 RepID=UPI003619B269